MNFRFLRLLLVIAPLLVFAQQPSATLIGTVHDASGAVITGASLEIRNTDTNELRKLVSSDSGEFARAQSRARPVRGHHFEDRLPDTSRNQYRPRSRTGSAHGVLAGDRQRLTVGRSRGHIRALDQHGERHQGRGHDRRRDRGNAAQRARCDGFSSPGAECGSQRPRCAGKYSGR